MKRGGVVERKVFKREYKEEKPVLAICYDFDKTLSPDDMQAQGYIQSVGYDIAEDFWKKSNSLAEQNDMDQNLAYMYMMKEEAEGRVLFTKQKLIEYGAKVKLFPGVVEWFERIRKYGEDKNVIVEHYIISSGLKEMIEGTSVAKAGAFKAIYASSFYYNAKGVAKWPAQVVNYTNKTQFLFRIEKGVLDVNDQGINDFFSPEEIRVPFRNIVYIGDSATDIPCMKLVNSYGGHSIGVYNADTKDKTKVYKMMHDERIKYFAPADYSDGSELDTLVKAIIIRTSANEALEAIHYSHKKERIEADKQVNEDERVKTNLLISFESSNSFASTHALVNQLQKIDKWTDDEINHLLEIAVNNNQVRCILRDRDVCCFYKKLIKNLSQLTPLAKQVRNEIEG